MVVNLCIYGGVVKRLMKSNNREKRGGRMNGIVTLTVITAKEEFCIIIRKPRQIANFKRLRGNIASE